MSKAAVFQVIVGCLAWLGSGACTGDPVTPAAISEVDSIWVAPAERSIGVLGTQFDVGAAALADDGSILYGSTMDPESFAWSSSAPDVAALGTRFHEPTGNHIPVITRVGDGAATITATSGGITSTTHRRKCTRCTRRSGQPPVGFPYRR